jgi:hypothetical protein
LVPLAAVPLLVAATHGSKRLTVLGCGATITSNTTLAADIGPCSGTAVTIDADHVTLNLNGHLISGSAGGEGVFSDVSNVTVQNGRVEGFQFGVDLEGNASRVMNMRVADASATGIVLLGQNDLVSGNHAFANTASGIVGHGGGSQYTNNILQGNTDEGLSVDGAALISGNKALSNGNHGISFSPTQTVAVTNNVANGNHLDGMLEFSTAFADPTLSTLSGNKAYFNGQNGILALPGATDGGNNKADENGTATQCTNIVCS